MTNDFEKYASRLDISRMAAIMPRRMAHILGAKPDRPRCDYAANRTAAALHPEKQELIVSEVIDREDGAKSFVLSPNSEKGTASLALFRAGQFLSFQLAIGKSTVTRAYSICCPPSMARDGRYMITVKPSTDGFAGNWIIENWTVGTAVTASAPLGEFYYTRLRDAKQVVGVAGGSGITPFYAMAAAIAEGSESFELTLIYGSRDRDSVVLGAELEALAASCDKVKLVNVLEASDGFITAELIEKYAPRGDWSLFICGSEGLMKHMEKELPKLGLPERRIRRKTYGVTCAVSEADCPKGLSGRSFTLSVTMRDKDFSIPCSSDETLLVAMERAGLAPPSHCRSGECGWCRSRLAAGEVFIPERTDRRRLADKEYGYIHPCCTFPASDVSLHVGCE